MKTCPFCGIRIEDWEALCRECWGRAEDAYRARKLENGELVERLKGKAKQDLLEIMSALCRTCSKFAEDISDPSCQHCVFKEKEKLIRAFLE